MYNCQGFLVIETVTYPWVQHTSLERPSSLQEEVSVKHRTKTYAWLETVGWKEEEKEGEGASGTFSEVNGGQDECLRNFSIIAKGYLLICVAVLFL